MSEDYPRSGRAWVYFSRSTIGIAVFCGALFRLIPLVSTELEMFGRFPTEDGYLAMTIGRDMSLGLGPSVPIDVSGNRALTNGFQPLCVLLWSAAFWLVDGNRYWGTWLILAFSTLVAAATCYVIWRVGRRLLAPLPWGSDVAAITAAIWFATPQTMNHTMNGLETGMLSLVSAVTVWAFMRDMDGQNETWSWRRRMAWGGLLGSCTWIRVDAVFLILASCCAWLLVPGRGGRLVVHHRLKESIVSGALAILVASPWLAFGYVLFGRLMPISGVAQASYSTFGGNLYRAGPALLSYIFPVAPGHYAPGAWLPDDTRVWPLLVALPIGVAALVGLARVSRELRPVVALLAIYSLGMFAYYALSFGAPHFLSRYFMPLSPFLIMAGLGLLMTRLRRWRVTGRVVLGLLFAVTLVRAGMLNELNRQRSTMHPHFGVVYWVETRLDPDTWVGALQTGTLGFFHDKTINLDGKVNPVALEHLLAGTLPAYVVSTGITLFVDWPTSLGWLPEGSLDGFEQVHIHHGSNVVVLQRVP
ncbi:MAG: hypothetical protein KDK70_01095 [Myxococcales bacterium]|nr:hypothetical protein [Myxococcales bacterium]